MSPLIAHGILYRCRFEFGEKILLAFSFAINSPIDIRLSCLRTARLAQTSWSTCSHWKWSRPSMRSLVYFYAMLVFTLIGCEVEWTKIQFQSFTGVQPLYRSIFTSKLIACVELPQDTKTTASLGALAVACVVMPQCPLDIVQYGSMSVRRSLQIIFARSEVYGQDGHIR